MEMKRFELANSGHPPFRGVGALVADLDSAPDQPVKHARWYELKLYRTAAGYVIGLGCRSAFVSKRMQREEPKDFVFKAANLDAVGAIIRAHDVEADIPPFPLGERFDRRRKMISEGVRRALLRITGEALRLASEELSDSMDRRREEEEARA